MKQAYYTTLFVSVASAAPLATETHVALNNSIAPLLENQNAVPGRYIVQFKDGHNMNAHESYLSRNLSSVLHARWDNDDFWPPWGYAANLDNATLTLVRADPMIDFVEQDYSFNLISHLPSEGTRSPPANDTDALERRSPTFQKNAAWNLVVTSAQTRRKGNTPGSFFYDTNAQGAGVDIYIADSGINIAHKDFGGRAKNAFDATETTFTDESNIGGTLGHGTQVADVAGGTTYGAAKKANLLSVKFATGPNNVGLGYSAVMGIKYATGKHMKKVKAKTAGFRGSIINYSLDIPPPSDKASLGEAIEAADSAGIVQVAAAGNSNDDAINHLPAADSPPIITVASMTDQYALSSSTSYGNKVTIIAPGTGITAATADPSNDEYSTTGGTSMAAPLVTGVIAQWLSWPQGPTTVAEVKTMLNRFALQNLVDLGSKTGTPNYLINSGAMTKGWPGHGDGLK